MHYDSLIDKQIDEALDQLEKQRQEVPNTIYYPEWNGKEWVYKPIKPRAKR